MSFLRFFVPIAQAASLTDKSSETASQSEEAVTSFISYLWDHLDNWIAAIVVVVFSVYFSKMLKRIVVDKVADKMGDEHEEILILVGRATYAAVLAVGLTIGLKVGGIDLTVIIAAVGFGIGFALQDIIMNFIAGVILLATRQFTIGDFIEVNGTLGKVKEIQSRATILQALDGTKVIVPNADLFTNQVTSYTTNPFRRIEIPVGVEYRTDLKKATNVMLAVLHAHEKVLKEPAPAVILDEFADSSINFKVRFWVESKDKWIDIKSQLIEQLKSALDDAGIGIPFPIRTLVFDKDTESAVIPTYAMTEEEMKQHKMEQIQTQEDQAEKDAANEALQAEYAAGDSHTEHVDLETLEEQHAAEADSNQKSVVSSEAPVAEESADGGQQMAEEAAKPEEVTIPDEPAQVAEEAPVVSADSNEQMAEQPAAVETQETETPAEEVKPVADETAPTEEVPATDSSEPVAEVAETPAPAEPAQETVSIEPVPSPEPTTQVAEETSAAEQETDDKPTTSTDSSQQMTEQNPSEEAPLAESAQSVEQETPEAAEQPAQEEEKVDATATITQVEPATQLAAEPAMATTKEDDVAGADFLSSQ